MKSVSSSSANSQKRTQKPPWLAAVITVFLWQVAVHAQPKIEWSRTYSKGDYDMAHSVRQTKDGGYIIAGETRCGDYGSANYYPDVWLIKTDSKGNESWSRTYGGPRVDKAYYVQQTKDGGYVVTGSGFHHRRTRLLLMRTDSEGNQLWEKRWARIEFEAGFCVQETGDGGYIIVGGRRTGGGKLLDLLLVKTDGEGNELWSRTFSGIRPGNSVQETADGGYVVTGTRSGLALIMKTDSEGNELWSKTYGTWPKTYGRHIAAGRSVQQTKDGGYIMVGYARRLALGGQADIYVIKTDCAGDTLWTRTYGGDDWDHGESVHQTSDGGYVVAGWTASRGWIDTDIWVIKTDASGDSVWTITLDGGSLGKAYSVQQTEDGGYIVAGCAGSHSHAGGNLAVLLVKLAPEGAH